LGYILGDFFTNSSGHPVRWGNPAAFSIWMNDSIARKTKRFVFKLELFEAVILIAE
jgi:hypothetical protein